MKPFNHLTKAQIRQRLIKLAAENGGVLTKEIVVAAARKDAYKDATEDALYAHRVIANACAGGVV